MFEIKIQGLKGTVNMFKQLSKKSPLVAFEIVKEGSKRMKTYAQAKVPKRSGALQRSIVRRAYQTKNPYAVVKVGEGLNPAMVRSMEFGSKPHYIWTNPIWAYIHQTQDRMHPGTRPTWFWRNSVRQITKEFPKVMKIGWNKHFKGDLRL